MASEDNNTFPVDQDEIEEILELIPDDAEKGSFVSWKRNKSRRTRNVNFTFNCYTEEHLDAMDKLGARGFAMQEELAPSTGHPHIQGFVRFNKAYNFWETRELFAEATGDETTYLSISDLPKASIRYCTDPDKRAPGGSVWVEGDLQYQQGKRNDIMEVKDIVTKPGWKHIDVIHNYPVAYAKYYRAFDNMSFWAQLERIPEIRKVEVWWLWGDTGLGKSRLAREGLTRGGADPEKRYFKPMRPRNGVIWFDGYEGQRTLILEELNSTSLEFDEFKEMTDIYPYTAPVKGAAVGSEWTRVIVTCQQHYSTLWPTASSRDIAAIARRVTFEKEFREEHSIVHNPSTGFFNVISRRADEEHDRRSVPPIHAHPHVPPYSVAIGGEDASLTNDDSEHGSQSPRVQAASTTRTYRPPAAPQRPRPLAAPARNDVDDELHSGGPMLRRLLLQRLARRHQDPYLRASSPSCTETDGESTATTDEIEREFYCY